MRPLLIALATVVLVFAVSAAPAHADPLICVRIGAVSTDPPLPPYTYDPPDVCLL